MNFPLYRPTPPESSLLPAFPVFAVLIGLGAAVSVAVVSQTSGRPTLSDLTTPQGVVVALVGLAALGLLALADSVGRGYLRRWRARRLYAREVASFDGDLRDALARERSEILRAAKRSNGLTIGHGSIDSRVRVVGDHAALVQRGIPLVIPPPGELRVLGPPLLADVVIDALVSQVRGRTADSVVDDRVVDGTRRVTIGPCAGAGAGSGLRPGAGSGSRNSSPRWVLTSNGPRSLPGATLTELWLGPDGTACARSIGQAGGAWVPVDPWIG